MLKSIFVQCNSDYDIACTAVCRKISFIRSSQYSETSFVVARGAWERIALYIEKCVALFAIEFFDELFERFAVQKDTTGFLHYNISYELITVGLVNM